MAGSKKNRTQVSDETKELRNRLEETEETLQAIRQYLVDAFVVTGSNGAQVFTLSEAEFPYRMMVEAMNEGAITIIPDGTIFYCNRRFGEMLEMEPDELIGIRFRDLIAPAEQEAFTQLLAGAGEHGLRGEFCLQSASGTCIRVQLSIYQLTGKTTGGISIIATDLTERMQAEQKIRTLASALTKAEQVERHRISQILHDDLQQRLFAIKAQLSMLTYGKEDQVPSHILTGLGQAQTELSNTISITRNLSINLSPIVLHGEGLADAIVWLSSQMKEQFNLDIDVLSTVDLNHQEDHMRVLLFRAVRELLFNIVKHANIKQAVVKLEQIDGHIHITVSDTGTGFDVQRVLQDSTVAHGLLIIQERLSLVGGSMEVNSKPGEGTQVVIKTPLQTSSA